MFKRIKVVAFVVGTLTLAFGMFVNPKAKAESDKVLPGYMYTLEGPGGKVYVYCDDGRKMYLYPTPNGAGIAVVDAYCRVAK